MHSVVRGRRPRLQEARGRAFRIPVGRGSPKEAAWFLPWDTRPLREARPTSKGVS